MLQSGMYWAQSGLAARMDANSWPLSNDHGQCCINEGVVADNSTQSAGEQQGFEAKALPIKLTKSAF